MNMLSLLALSLWSAAAQPDSGRLSIFIDGKKVGTEEFAISRGKGGFIATGRTQVSVGGETYDLRSHMELDEEMRPLFYEYQRQDSFIRIRIHKGAASELEYASAGKVSPQDIRFPDDGAIIDNNFFHHYILLLQRFRSAELTVPVVVPQSMTLGQIVVRPAGPGRFELETDALKMRVELDTQGRLIRMTDPSGKVVVER